MLTTLALLCGCALLDFNSLQASDSGPTLPKPELIHFENQVETQPLEAVAKPRNGVHHTLNLSTGPAGNQNIQIPSNRPFKIVFKGGGSGLSVVDNNALDGEATVQLPSGMLEGYLQATGSDQSKPKQRITYSDALYHSEQILTHSEKPQWYRISKRPMPIPADWHSEDGADYVLHFDNQGQEQISFRWYPVDNEEPDYPVGMKLIGPEGGVVELPGVGKLELPAGALTEKTLVRMSQVFEGVTEILSLDGGTYKYKREKDFISPVVKIEPLNLKLVNPGILYLQTDLERLGTNAPGFIDWMHASDLDEWSHIDTKSDGLSQSQWTVNMPVEVYELEYYAKTIYAQLQPNMGQEIHEEPDYWDVDLEVLNNI